MVLSGSTAAGSARPRVRTALWVVPVSDLGGVARHVVDVFRYAAPPPDRPAQIPSQPAEPAPAQAAPNEPPLSQPSGWRFVLLCPPGPLAEAVAAVGGQVHTAQFGPQAGLRSSLISLRSAIRRWHPDLVHTHLAYADIAAALATPRGIPLVSTEHGIADDDRVYHSSGVLLRMMGDVHRLRLARVRASGGALIAVSEATAAAMRRKWHPRLPIEVIHNGVDRLSSRPERPQSPAQQSPAQQSPTQQSPAQQGDAAAQPRGIPGGLRVASIARLAPEKRLDALLEAFAVLRREHPTATLTLAGTGPQERQLRDHVARLGLADAVQLPGHVDAAALLAHTDVVAQLSVWENCSYTLLDAVVAGVGVVATAVGGNPEILPERCLVEPDDPKVVAGAIARQALPADRPALAPGWPTVADMRRSVLACYQGVVRA